MKIGVSLSHLLALKLKMHKCILSELENMKPIFLHVINRDVLISIMKQSICKENAENLEFPK